MLILCKEIDKYGVHRPKYYIVKKNPVNSDLLILTIRNRMNPELQYYATALDEIMDEDKVLKIFKATKKYKEPEFLKI